MQPTRLLLLVSSVLFAAAVKGEPACQPYEVPDHTFRYKVQQTEVTVRWHDEWTAANGESLPAPLDPHESWENPHLQYPLPGAMHEDAGSTDVSNLAGPVPENAKVHYFHVLEKGKRFSGMAPYFTFLDDETVLTISFGRDAATLLLIDIESLEVLDSVDIPGRGSSIWELTGAKGRLKIFRDTSGGAYSYLSQDGYVYVPAADNRVLRIPMRDRAFDRQNMKMLDLTAEVAAGSLTDVALSKKHRRENRLTALFPDADGRVWFTTRLGVVGLIDPDELDSDGCPTVHTTFLGYFAWREKVVQAFGGNPEEIEAVIPPDADVEDWAQIESTKETVRGWLGLDSETHEEIQNSFSTAEDGVYILSNIALHKFQFHEGRIRLDPAWVPTYAAGDLIYDNDWQIKPGHLNAGSGTTPTIIDDRFVAIVDNAPHVNLLVFSQHDGSLVTKYPLFEEGRGAVENSVVAYGDSLIVPNMYGYVDPFVTNDTPGGMLRFDWNEDMGSYEPVDGWPATGHIDPKTATPKLSTANGLIYIYHREDEATNGHRDWVLTAVDFRTGLRVFSIKGWFEKGQFKDNVSPPVKGGALGLKNYDRKVFNNILATYSFGPGNSIWIGAYRGFLRFSSESP